MQAGKTEIGSQGVYINWLSGRAEGRNLCSSQAGLLDVKAMIQSENKKKKKKKKTGR
jgi:hypothetical protein